MLERLKTLAQSDHAWWQGGLFLVLAGGLLLLGYLLRNRQMDLIYSLF